MTRRMENPAGMLRAVPALLKVSDAVRSSGVPEQTLELIHLRASQINRCSFCVDMAGTALLKMGVAPERIIAVAAWRESEHFDRAERAALAAAEEATRLADHDGLTDATWDELAANYPGTQVAAILLNIAPGGAVELDQRCRQAGAGRLVRHATTVRRPGIPRDPPGRGSDMDAAELREVRRRWAGWSGPLTRAPALRRPHRSRAVATAPASPRRTARWQVG